MVIVVVPKSVGHLVLGVQPHALGKGQISIICAVMFATIVERLSATVGSEEEFLVLLPMSHGSSFLVADEQVAPLLENLQEYTPLLRAEEAERVRFAEP